MTDKPIAIIFYNPHNRPFKSDGDEFELQAHNAEVHYRDKLGYEVKMYAIPKGKKEEKRRFVLSALGNGIVWGGRVKDVDRIMFFDHGGKNHIASGFNRKNIGELVADIKKTCKPDAVISLYSCLTGAKKLGGFASKLHVRTGLMVFAHKTSGHTTKNPHKRVFWERKMANLYPKDRALFKKQVRDFWDSNDYYPFVFIERYIIRIRNGEFKI